MLKIPSFLTLGDVTAYQDDAEWYRFYLLPARPAVRRDDEGRPVFLLATYHLSDQERAEEPELPRGGGYMSFDVEFAVSEEERETARAALQRWVDEETARRRADPELADDPALAGPEPPQVVLADPTLSGGTVTMVSTQSDLLVTDRFAEAPASVVSGSTAVFNMDLTELGAEFMQELMVGDDGVGATDLTPVQVIYDLEMWARLPPVKISVSAASERVHETLLSASESNRDNPCTPSEVETFRENGVNSSTLHEAGDVDVKIDEGNAEVSDEVVQELQDYALDLFDTMIEERFLVPAEGEEGHLELDEDEEVGDRDPGWVAVLYSGPGFSGESLEVHESLDDLGSLSGVRSVRVRPGHRVTLLGSRGSRQLTASTADLGRIRLRFTGVRIWRPPTTRYKVRRTVNHATMELSIEIERSQVVAWPTGGQATLESFLGGLEGDALRRHVVEIFADDFDTLGVTVRALADFEADPIQAVEVQTEYVAETDSGERRTVPGAFTFRAGETAAQRFDPTVIGGERRYRHRHRVIWDDGTAGAFTPWEVTTSRALNIPVIDPGRLDLEVSGASLNWEVVRSVTVELSYEPPGSPDEAVERTYELTEGAPVARWQRRFRGEVEGEIDVRTTYTLEDGKVIAGEPRSVAVSDNLLVVRQPQVDVLNVGLVPAGDWSDVAQAVVSLEYDAGDGRVYDRVYRLTSIDQYAEWTVLLRDPDRRTFRYQTLVTYRSGGSDSSGWITASGDQAIPIEVAGEPRLEVQVLTSLVDFTATPAVAVSLTHGEHHDTLGFTSPDAESWRVPLDPGEGGSYTYEITWHPADGDPVASGPKRTRERQLFVPRLRLPEAGELRISLRGFAVDFDATPFVDVELTWNDGSGERSETVTLSAEQPNRVWEAALGDRDRRTYSYAITYNLADGSRVAGDAGRTDDPVISVTPYEP